MLDFDRSTVKHALQSTQNDCHLWHSDSSRVNQIRFQQVLRPGPRWGSLQHTTDPLAGLRGPTSKGKGGEKKGKKMQGMEREGKRGDRREGEEREGK